MNCLSCNLVFHVFLIAVFFFVTHRKLMNYDFHISTSFIQLSILNFLKKKNITENIHHFLVTHAIVGLSSNNVSVKFITFITNEIVT